ncbi:MAG: aminotransferase class I/II-fold pyridoxal phosphate-dependent enzyme [Chitinophagaceae bacterium]|nr:aminotransferase class I/II-fold pyridoxal phosphate-dependent enzyme [Anaerolineae bacterium]
MPSQSARLNALPPYVFVAISERIRQLEADGIPVVRLDIGNPDMPPPSAVIESLADSARQPYNHGYSGYRGTASFREEVAQYYKTRFNVTINPETQVLPVIGSKEGIVNLSLAYLDRGDLALVPSISYPAYSLGAQLAGADVHWIPTNVTTNYLPDTSSIPVDVARRSKLFWVNYPNNPTGATTDLAFYHDVLDYCMANDILLVSDNPYVEVTFDGYIAPSLLEVPSAADHTVEFISFSKSYNMAGWRLGAAVGSPKALKTLLQIKSNMDSGHFKSIYDAGITALETPQSWIESRNRIYQRRRDKVIAALPEIGLEAATPKGSLYIWAKVLQGDANTYIEHALTEAHVTFAPGAAYGPDGEGFIRISLGVEDNQLNLAINNLKSWYAKA